MLVLQSSNTVFSINASFNCVSIKNAPLQQIGTSLVLSKKETERREHLPSRSERADLYSSFGRCGKAACCPLDSESSLRHQEGP